ncbi:hypothetical protein WMY93_011908 [Mugilogobius chulae]|uniref:Uncharacterized protein n=1 Tax=Mugilogobius chulae TaxID=88201 RepID=A0AAW0PCW4_9GOBI
MALYKSDNMYNWYSEDYRQKRGFAKNERVAQYNTISDTDRRKYTAKAAERADFVKSDDKYNWYSEDYQHKRRFPPAPVPSTSVSETIEDYKVRVKKLEETIKGLRRTVCRFEERLNLKEAEKRALKTEVNTETRLCKTAEDERDALKEEMEFLKKDLEKVRAEQAEQRQTFTVVIQKTTAAYEKAVQDKEELCNTNQVSIAKLQTSQQDLEKEKLQVLQEKEQLWRNHQEELSKNVTLFAASEIQKKAMEDKVEDLETLVVQIRPEEVCKSALFEQEMTALKEELRGQKQKVCDIEQIRAEEAQRSTVCEQEMEALNEELRGQKQKVCDVEQIRAEEAQRSTVCEQEMEALKEELRGQKQKVCDVEQIRAEEAQRSTVCEQEMEALKEELRGQKQKVCDIEQIRAEEAQRSTVCEQDMEALNEELRGQQQETTVMEDKVEDLETPVVQLRAEEAHRSALCEQEMAALKEELRGQQQKVCDIEQI